PTNFANVFRSSSIGHITGLLVQVAACALGLASAAYCQDRTADEGAFRGSRAAVSVTLKDSSGTILEVPATLRAFHSVVMSCLAATSKGRASFILSGLGDFTIFVEASGYKPAQKEVTLMVAITDEEDIILQRDSASNAVLPGT